MNAFLFKGMVSSMSRLKRWYDKNPELKKWLERLKHAEEEKRNIILDGIKQLDSNFDSDLIDRHVMEFPMEMKRRWYDQNPYCWLIINGLKYADDIFLQKVIDYLQRELPHPL